MKATVSRFGFLAIALLATSGVGASRASAAAIGGVSVHFNSEGFREPDMTPGNSLLLPADAAGVVPLTHWNNTTNWFGGPVALTDDQGAPTSVTATWTSPIDNRFTSGHTGTDGNSKMTNGEFESGSTGPAVVTVTGIPYASVGYDVYIYVGTDVNGRKGHGTFAPAAGASKSVYFISNDGYTSPTFQGYVLATGTSDANSIPSNYLYFHDVHAASFTYSQFKSDGEPGGIGIHGVEIVALPEPGAALPTLGAAAGLLRRRRARA